MVLSPILSPISKWYVARLLVRICTKKTSVTMRLDHVLRNIDNILVSIVMNTTGMAYVIISREMRIFHFDLDLNFCISSGPTIQNLKIEMIIVVTRNC